METNNATIIITTAYFAPDAALNSAPELIRVCITAKPPMSWTKDIQLPLSDLSARVLRRECSFIRFDEPDRMVDKLLLEDTSMTYQTGTIRQICQQLCDNGHKVTENTLRTWVKQGILPAAFIGKKAYIVYDNVVNILRNGTPVCSKEINSNGIRKINC